MFFVDATEDTGSCCTTEAGAVAEFTLCQGQQVPFVICNEEKEGRRRESGTTEARGEFMTLCLTFGLLPWTLEDTDLRWHVSCQSPSDKLSLWSRIFLYFVCAQILGYLLQVSSTSIIILFLFLLVFLLLVLVLVLVLLVLVVVLVLVL